METHRPASCPICGGTEAHRVFVYHEPPAIEIRFKGSDENYYREMWQCDTCLHYISTHAMDVSELYSGEYMNANYQDAAGIRRTFQRIVSLPPERSDNTGRVQRVVEVARDVFGLSAQNGTAPTILDVGSGLGVFPHGMKNAGWQCTALDPDERAVAFAREVVGVDGVCGDFMAVDGVGRFDVVSFNKVLEHVPDPVAMLRKSLDNVQEQGCVYVEVPDGEMSALEGKDREEFCIDHLHVFSFTSLALLAVRAGFVPVLIERLHEPSTKYTLRAFLSPGPRR